MAPQLESTLPLELERHIFILTALSYPYSIPKLLLVAWRVTHWLEPILYRTLVVSSSVLLPKDLPVCSIEIIFNILRNKPTAFLQQSICNLLLDGTPEVQTKIILSTCVGVENLCLLRRNRHYFDAFGISTAPPLARLTHLHCAFDELFKWEHTGEFLRTSFPQLSHLEFFGQLPAQQIVAPLAALPRLTHLAFPTSYDSHLHASIYAQILDACALLRLIVLHSAISPTASSPLGVLGAQDIRCIVILWHEYNPDIRAADWLSGIQLGVDFWSLADDLVTKRMTGTTDRTLPTSSAERDLILLLGNEYTLRGDHLVCAVDIDAEYLIHQPFDNLLVYFISL
ncbi:hypothetical protein FB45DRAFT_910572 [Roridomyces roridus]|uniref:Uncharacterized protein n=1 Tax=Roridomyces roridus TaxID=1738132 RepID=A0AAD7BZV9_9AGAR|nr:hypothetical protein FB45DRAFT_910572 [Roridomyces roridus]